MSSLRARRLCLALSIALMWASVSMANGWQLFKDGVPVGVVPVREDGDETYAAIGEMARFLGFSAKKLNDGLLVNKGAVSLQVIPNAAAVWLGYEILPLKRQAFIDGGRWWMDVDSSLTVMEKLLFKAGEKSSLLWRGDGSSKEPLPERSPEPPSPDPISVSVPGEPSPAPILPATPVLATSFTVRWGVHEDRIRLVVESEGPIPFRSIEDGVELTFPNRQEIGGSPDPSIDLQTKEIDGKWILSVVAKGWSPKIFELPSPHRVVADFLRPVAETMPSEPVTPQPVVAKAPPGKRGRPLVVVDAGHGGKDPGAVANGYREKELALQIAGRLVKNIQALGMDARLTREDDRYLLLKTRTELANKWDADAFVSIHLNALPKGRHAKGVEIYIMALPTDKDAMELAKIENAELMEGSVGQGDDKTSLLLSILGDMQQNNKIQESTRFAEALFASGESGRLPMRRVAQAPFFVLRGAAMPAVLVETGFISEKSEAKMLADPGYQERLAKSLAQGIAKYLK